MSVTRDIGSASAPLTFALASVIVTVSALGPLGTQLVLPALPEAGRALGASPETIRLAFPIFILGLAIGQPVYGPISDRIGRRKALIGGLCLFVLGALFTVLATSAPMFLVGRALEGLGACAGVALGRAIISDIAERDRAGGILADLKVAMIVVPMVAPWIGGWIAVELGWSMVFLVLGAVGAAGLLLVAVALPETARSIGQPLDVSAVFRDYGSLLRDPDFLVPATVIAFSTAAFFSFLGGGAFVVSKAYGFDPKSFGAALAIVNGGFLVGNLLAGRLNTRVGAPRMMLFGAGFAFLSAVVLAAVSLSGDGTANTVFGLMAAMSFGHGFCVQNGFAFAMKAQPDRNGAASGLAGCFQMGLGAGFAALSGSVAGATLAGPMLLIALATGIALVATVVLFLKRV